MYSVFSPPVQGTFILHHGTFLLLLFQGTNKEENIASYSREYEKHRISRRLESETFLDPVALLQRGKDPKKHPGYKPLTE